MILPCIYEFLAYSRVLQVYFLESPVKEAVIQHQNREERTVVLVLSGSAEVLPVEIYWLIYYETIYMCVYCYCHPTTVYHVFGPAIPAPHYHTTMHTTPACHSLHRAHLPFAVLLAFPLLSWCSTWSRRSWRCGEVQCTLDTAPRCC